MADEEDLFAAFGGSDSDQSDDDGETFDAGSSGSSSIQLERAADAAILHITTTFLSQRKSTHLSNRYVALSPSSVGSTAFMQRLTARGIQIVSPGGDSKNDPIADAGVLFYDNKENKDNMDIACRENEKKIRRGLVKGGFLLLCLLNGGEKIGNDTKKALRVCDACSRTHTSSPLVYDLDQNAQLIHSRFDGQSECIVVAITKRSCLINSISCPWKDLYATVPSSMAHCVGETALEHELAIATRATITRTAEEMRSFRDQKYPPLPDESIQDAVRALQTYGFVVLNSIFDPETQTQPWGDATLKDFSKAAEIVRARDNVDILNPGRDGMNDPLNYREMAMREDLRVDLRNGPTMQSLRVKENKRAYQQLGLEIDTDEDKGPTILTTPREGTVNGSIRFHPSVLRIARALFNPHTEEDNKEGDGTKTKLYKGNFGRWNFGGAGPDGTPQPIRVGQVGTVLSLPGSGDQAMHADTPHLFEHIDCLPCHYANLFTPGRAQEGVMDEDGCFTGGTYAAGTSFVYGSHRLSVTAKMTAEDASGVEKGSTIFSAASSESSEKAMHLRMIRPSLEMGDALIFDTRILHQGLANNATLKEDAADANQGRRPMLYVNLTHSWFHDPKNWDDRKGIFEV
jgi:hypothetical protein